MILLTTIFCWKNQKFTAYLTYLNWFLNYLWNRKHFDGWQKTNYKTVKCGVHKIQIKSAPNIFLTKFSKISHSYSTRFSHLNYVIPIPKRRKCKYIISCRGPLIWNSFFSTRDKQITDVPKFKAITKSKLFSLKNEISFF